METERAQEDRRVTESPHELSFDLHPFLSSIEQIADHHGLHHDSGVSFKSQSSKSATSKTTRSNSSFLNTVQQNEVPNLSLPSSSSAASSNAGMLAVPGASSTGSSSSASASGSGSATYLKRPSNSQAEGGDERMKRVIESPGTTAEYDARDETWYDVTRRLKPFGDTLRHERLRTQLGETELGKQCVGMLTYSTSHVRRESVALLDAQVEMMRILGNLCIDHDVNREKMLKEGAPQAIVRLLQTDIASEHDFFDLDMLLLLRTAVGALLNMQLDHASTRESMRNEPTIVRTLLQLATDERIYRLGSWYQPQGHGNSHASGAEEWRKHIVTGSSVATWAWRIVQDVCAGGSDEGSENGGEPKKKATDVDEEDSEKTIESLVNIGASECAGYLIQPLLTLLQTSHEPTVRATWTGDDVSDLMESDMEIVQVTAELIESCALDSQSFRRTALKSLPSLQSVQKVNDTPLAFFVHFIDVAKAPQAWSRKERKDSDHLPPQPSDEESAKEVEGNFARAKAAVARGIVGIVGEDENMTKLFEGGRTSASEQGSSFVESMKEWMTRDSKARDDLVSTAMLAVGNLARNDAHCVALVHEHNLVPTLTTALSPTADINVSYGVICLLKNLAIPSTNKQIIGTSNDLIARLAAFLEPNMDRVQPLQFAAVGLLKHLCSGCLVNAQDLVLKQTMSVLLSLLARTDDVPTRMEGTRVLVNAIKTVWSSKQSDNSGLTSPDSAERSEARKLLTVQPVAEALAEMIKGSTKYPILVNEGILALTLLSSQRDCEPTGSELVAKALSVLLPSRQTSSSSERGVNEQRQQQEQQATESNGNNALQAPRLPQRQTTLDALASTTPQPLPVPRSGADMISTVLLRRDARMPPQFANNACALVETLVQALPDGNPASAATSNASIVSLVQAWQPALEQLSNVGPQETMPIAQRAAERVSVYLAAQSTS